jgi:hypothetical protein
MGKFSDGFRGSVNGAVQTTYADQPGQAIAGMLAFASDINNCDAVFIGETNGIEAGKGVQFIIGDEGLGFQRPAVLAYLPDGDEAAAEMAGIVVFDEAMQSMADGDGDPINGWAKGRVARILRPGRGGGRIYVKAKEAVVPGTSTVNWVIAVGSDAKYELGEFAPGVLNSGTVGTTVAIANAKWITAAAAGEVAMLELYGTVVPTFDSSI